MKKICQYCKKPKEDYFFHKVPKLGEMCHYCFSSHSNGRLYDKVRGNWGLNSRIKEMLGKYPKIKKKPKTGMYSAFKKEERDNLRQRGYSDSLWLDYLD